MIAAKVKVSQSIAPDCLISTPAMAGHMPHKAGEVVIEKMRVDA